MASRRGRVGSWPTGYVGRLGARTPWLDVRERYGPVGPGLPPVSAPTAGNSAPDQASWSGAVVVRAARRCPCVHGAIDDAFGALSISPVAVRVGVTGPRRAAPA